MRMLVKLLEFLFTYYHVYKLDLSKSTPKDLSLPKGFIFRTLNVNDSYLFKNLKIREDYLKTCIDRLSNDRIITFAIIDSNSDCLAAYSCVNMNDSYYLSVLNKTYNLKKNKSYFFEDDNTIEKYRKLGFSSFIMNERIKFSIKNNRHSYGFVHPTNLPSVKTLKKFNFNRTLDFPFSIRREAIIYLRKKIYEYFSRK